MPPYVSRLAGITSAAVTALRSALAGPPVSGRIYTQAPTDLELPCVTVQAAETIWGDSETGEGSRVSVIATIYSAQPGLAEVDAIAGSVATVLTTASTWAAWPGASWQFVEHGRAYLADLDGRLVTVRETTIQVSIP